MVKGYINESDGSVYSFTSKDSIIKIFYSKKGNWSERVKGKRCLKMTTPGDLKYTVELRGQKLTLDICQLVELGYAIKILEKTVKHSVCKSEMSICQK
jgi:hypothetical protein